MSTNENDISKAVDEVADKIENVIDVEELADTATALSLTFIQFMERVSNELEMRNS